MYSYYLKALLKNNPSGNNPSGSATPTHLPLHKGGNGAAMVGTSDNNVGASNARPLSRLCRQCVTVIPQYNQFPLFVAHWLNASCPCVKGAVTEGD